MPSLLPAIRCGASLPARAIWMWERWRAIATPRISCGQTLRPGAWPSRPTKLGAGLQYVADVTVDLGAVTTGFVDQISPFLGIFVQVGLGQQVRSLHDGLNGVAEIVRQGP